MISKKNFDSPQCLVQDGVETFFAVNREGALAAAICVGRFGFERRK